MIAIENSVLRDRVVFVLGAPRSGTTWLNSMLTAHPDLVGANESHLFDEGVNALFDNWESTDWERQFLRRYLTRDDLVDLVRDLCDGIFLRMRERRKPDATLVVEKTPFAAAPEAELRRKVDCYPDAWYIHLVRDPRAVARSSSRRWAQRVDRTARHWSESVRAVNDQLGGNPRLRHLRYEDLVAGPLETMHELFGWLGVRSDDETDALVTRAAGRQIEPRSGTADANVASWKRELPAATLHTIERVAGDVMVELGYELDRPAVPLRHRLSQPAREGLRTIAAAGPAKAVVGRLRRRLAPEAPPDAMEKPHDERLALAVHDIVNAFAASDEKALGSLLSARFEVEVKLDGSERAAADDDAMALLLDTAKQLFYEPFVTSSWVAAPARPISMAWFRGEQATGAPVEFALALKMDDYVASRIALLGHGPS